jgi:radical SAM family uncharacterized protein/radical SAM-linked protein
VKIDEMLPFVRKPSRYIGGEFNTVRKSWEQARCRIALVFPDLYEIGMSHQGLQILYHIVNEQPEYLAERSFVPDEDLEKLLRNHGQALFSLESRRPLGDFDIIGITLPYELCYANILTVLNLSRIPFRASDRSDAHPLIIGGGSCSFNPEPVADFFDAILLGDGEKAILDIAACVQMAKTDQVARTESLARLAGIDGVYVPSLFSPQYNEQGSLIGMAAKLAGYDRVRRRIFADMNEAVAPQPPLVPLTKIVHDRLGLEIARGCTRGCRFCQAGVIYRPVRERAPEQILSLARRGIASSGFEEVGLLSLSTGDYSCLPELMTALMDTFTDQKVSISMPSMRVGTLTPEIMAQIRRVRKTGFTVAPEAGTDRLRLVINKGITEEDLLATCEAAFNLGWKLIKFYFMIGLPTETAEDVQAIVQLARRALRKADTHKGCRITISVSLFVPKPHTPFQWERQISIDEAYARLNLLKKQMPRKGLVLKWHDPRQSFLEGVFSRGDRRLAPVIENAWRHGARLDGWSEHFDLAIWQQAARSCGIDLDVYLEKRSSSRVLPWQHLDSRVDSDFLQEESVRALAGEYTPDCRVHGCQQCGVCDFKNIKPVVHQDAHFSFLRPGAEAEESAVDVSNQAEGMKFVYRLEYSRLDAVRFLSHLEMIQVFFRALQRARVEVLFSQGFNPTPRVSFSPALPVGTESTAEFFDVELSRPLADHETFLRRLNRQLPTGIEVHRVVLLPANSSTKHKGPLLFGYEITLPRTLSAEEKSRAQRFLEAESFVVSLMKKGKPRQHDVRPQVKTLTIKSDDTVHLQLLHEDGRAGAKPLDLLQAVFAMPKDVILQARVIKGERQPVECIRGRGKSDLAGA